MLYFYITLYWHCTRHLRQPRAQQECARCRLCPVPAVPAAGACLVGRGLGSALTPAVTGQSPSCPHPASQCPSRDGASWKRRAWVGTSHVEVPSFSLPGDSLAAAIAGASPSVSAPGAVRTPPVSSSSAMVVVIIQAQQLEVADTVPWGQLLWSFRQRKLF